MNPIVLLLLVLLYTLITSYYEVSLRRRHYSDVGWLTHGKIRWRQPCEAGKNERLTSRRLFFLSIQPKKRNAWRPAKLNRYTYPQTRHTTKAQKIATTSEHTPGKYHDVWEYYKRFRHKTWKPNQSTYLRTDRHVSAHWTDRRSRLHDQDLPIRADRSLICMICMICMI